MKTKQQWIEDLNRLIGLRGKKGAEFDRLHIKCAYAAVDVDETFHTLVMSGDFELAKSHIGKAKNPRLEEATARQELIEESAREAIVAMAKRERLLDRAAVIVAGFVSSLNYEDMALGSNAVFVTEEVCQTAINAAECLDRMLDK